MLTKLKEKKGSTLIFALITMLVIVVLIAAMINIAYYQAKNSVTDRQYKQAYYSAKSACDAIAGELLNKNIKLIDAIDNSLKSADDTVTLSNIDFTVDNMGKLEISITRKADSNDPPGTTYLITAHANAGSASKTVSLEVFRNTERFHAGFPGFFVNYLNDDFSTDAATDMAVDYYSAASNSTYNFNRNLIILDPQKITGNLKIVVKNNLYTPSGTFTLKGSASLVLHETTFKGNGLVVSSSNSPYIFPNSALNLNLAVPTWADISDVTRTPFTSATTLERGKYYEVGSTPSTMYPSQILETGNEKVDADHPVFIIVKSGVTLQVNSRLDGPSPKTPRVFFILEGTAKLYVPASSSICAYGGVNTMVYVTGVSSTYNKLFGQVQAGKISNNGSTRVVNLTYVPMTFGQGSDSSAGTWEKMKYAKD
ncbi:MAG: hypothetical protein ACYCX2_06155 [Christensenellales bacterium]